MNSYRMGVDLRIAPRTVLSYDQFLDYYKGDTDYQLAPSTQRCLPERNSGRVGLVLRHCEQGAMRRADRPTSLISDGV